MLSGRDKKATLVPSGVEGWEERELHANILNSLVGQEIRFQECRAVVNGNQVTVGNEDVSFESLTDTMMMAGYRLIYWSVPAALLLLFRGDILGDALSVKERCRISHLWFMFRFQVVENPLTLMSCCLWQRNKNNILMTLRVSWGIQLISTSLIPVVPFSILTASLFFCKTRVKWQKHISLSTSSFHEPASV